MRSYTILVISVLMLVGFCACQFTFQQNANKGIIPGKSIFGDIVSSDSIFIFLAEEGFEHEFVTGTKIDIPAGALMDYKGEVVNGPVILSFNAYRDAIDLLVAGIMMDSEAGLNKTAGAFKINVEQAGKKLFLDPSRSIAIKLACYEKENDFGLYYFESEKNHWEYLYTSSPTINDPHVQLELAEKRMKPQIKFPLDEEYFALNYKGILDAVYDNKLTNVNHQQTQKKMEKYGLRWPNVEVDSLITYNGKRLIANSLIWQNVSRKPFPAWTKNEKGRLEKIRNSRYRLIVANGSGSKKFSTQVAAVMPLEKLFSYGPGFWRYDYYSKLKLVSAAQIELQTMPSAFRSFRINRFGIFNWQKIIDEVASVKIMAQLKQKENSIAKKGFTDFYYLTSDSKGIIYYPFTKWNNFTLYADPEAIIFAVLPDKELWLFTSESMKLVEFNQLKKMKNPSFLFKMEATKQKPYSVEELRGLLSHSFLSLGG